MHPLHDFALGRAGDAAGHDQAEFEPAPVPERFEREFPKPLMVRPSQLRAAAEDAALMTPRQWSWNGITAT